MKGLTSHLKVLMSMTRWADGWHDIADGKVILIVKVRSSEGVTKPVVCRQHPAYICYHSSSKSSK